MPRAINSSTGIAATPFTLGLLACTCLYAFYVLYRHQAMSSEDAFTPVKQNIDNSVRIQYEVETATKPKCNDSSNIPSGSDLIGIYGKTMELKVQLLFDQSLILLYGYNLPEARRNIDAAITMDPECGMCYWARAYAYSPNINHVVRWEEVSEGTRSIRTAFELQKSWKYSELELDLILAMKTRFADNVEDWKSISQSHYDMLYMQEMEKLCDKYRNSSDVYLADLLAFYADAVINTTPWKYFDSDKTTPLRDVSKAITALRRSLDLSGNTQLLALHLFIHITEQSKNPFEGKVAADALAAISSNEGTGHLSHMPAHTYYRIGSYEACIRSSLQAIEVDKYYINRCLQPYVPLHNRGLLVACAMSNGRMNLALDNSFLLEDTHQAIAIYLTGLFPTPMELIYARYGKWKEILDLHHDGDTPRQSQDRELSNSEAAAFITMISQYAYALAVINDNRHKVSSNDPNIVNLVSHHLNRISDTYSRVPYDPIGISHVFYPYHHEMAGFMNATAFASFAMAQGRYDEAIDVMATAVRQQEGFQYMEPEHYYIPLKQCLAAVYLAKATDKNGLMRNDVEMALRKAKDIYLSDLIDHPMNGWALRGLMNAKTYLLNASQSIQTHLHIRRDMRDMFLPANDPSHWDQYTVDELQDLFTHVWYHQDRVIQGSCCELGLC